MSTPLHDERLRAPAYARELTAVRARGEQINLHVHVGRDAWGRARRTGNHRLVVVLDDENPPMSYDFTSLHDLDVVLNAVDADLLLAHQVAIRMCEHGARLVVLLHPQLPNCSAFFYRAPRA